MFKNLLIYRIVPEWTVDFVDLDAALGKARFAECGATQPMALGWTSPRGDAHAPLVESVAGHWLMSLMVERKLVPGSVIKRQVDALAAKIELETGRKPGRKAKQDLKDQAMLELLPQAFTKRGSVRVWIAPAERLLAVDCGSQSKADEVLTALTEALPGFAARPINTAVSPAAAMAEWLVSGEAPAGFTIDRDCELKAAEGEKPAVRYARHTLEIVEIREHIAAGKQPTRLALTWNGRVSFVLTEGLQVKRIGFEDGVFEKQPGASRDENFDADAAISTGELLPMIGDLLDALGGEQALGEPAAGTATPASAAAPAAAQAPAPASAGGGSTRPPASDIPPWENETAA
ncbi:recombination-associated protein RdgC [Aquabacterium sp. OR-4]|uniref:recombination-associated protein RdgC n=1 Tax=Aquabacterium sp. OR-4 TaxID=2978127 RepID=UPI0028C9F8C1|nr:recombination-associated protein RdgC [Aquabacterium sp. OR-4]MDT7834607.1 recombination-associated protein RdgC [Aquabacterium sp. OR-4]